MGYRAPENGFSAELLKQNSSALAPIGRLNIVGAHLSYLHEIVRLRNPQFLHCDEVPRVLSDSDICESTVCQDLVFNFNLLGYYHRIWQSPISSSKSPQRDEEGLFFVGVEFVHCDALINYLRRR